jgi:hypothetical protein
VSVPITAIDGFDADDELRDLELTADELRDSALHGYTHAAGCTAHDPLSMGGFLAWGKGTGHFRDVKSRQGWKADRHSSYETTVHPLNTHCVAFAAGTADTGRADGLPRTRTPRGPATGRAVEQNAQLSLGHGNDIFAHTGEPVRGLPRQTWLLLHHYDRGAEEIRLELSLPLEMEGKQITRWSRRIILPPIRFSADVDLGDDDDDDGGSIDIDVPRKSN